CLFLFVSPPPTHISPLSLHDALPICSSTPTRGACRGRGGSGACPCPSSPGCTGCSRRRRGSGRARRRSTAAGRCSSPGPRCGRRSEEHTSELQSRENLVCRLLLEKKK